MTEKEKERTCENCEDEPATILCPECPKCYCDGCSEFTHRKGPKKDHKTEPIPEGVDVKATCSIHKDPLRMLCLDEVKLCCPTCVGDLHKGHKVVKIEDIKQDDEIFSAAEVGKSFEDTLKRSTTLNEKIDEIIEDINKEVEETKKKIEIFFDEEHQKLKDEEKKLINELEEACTKAIDQLNDFKSIIENANKYSSVLSEAADTLNLNDSDNDNKCSRLMELNIASEMEEQRRKIERLLGTEMRDLKISWDKEARKLSFTRNLFNGALSVRNVVVKAVSWDEMDVSWEIDGDEKSDDDEEIRYTVEMRKKGEKDWEEAKSGLTDKKCKVRGLMDNSDYEFRVRCVAKGGSLVSEWSSVVKGRTQKAPEFSECVWKECPDDVDKEFEYRVDGGNPRVATNVNSSDWCRTIGNTLIPLNKVTSWHIKILKSENNNGDGINIGIAPFDIDQDADDNYYECGWYFNCYHSSLYSGPPYNYRGKEYGPRKESSGQYVHTGDSVGVVMDTTKGELSFILSGVNLGIAFEGIPLDKPLVPCVLLWCQEDSVELDLSEVKKNEVDSSISVPSKITVKGITWDSITLTWDEVDDASLYQIEVDGSNSGDASSTNTFTKRGLLPETEHSFRVRTVRGSSVSEWSGVVRGRTLKAPEFSGCVWKECPDDVDDNNKYSVDIGNPKVATKMNDIDGLCTIIGNTPILLNKVTSWNIKILKSMNNGDGIFIGIAPFDINQDDSINVFKCGWYFDCYDSTLWSGPPHNYSFKEYGPRKESNGQYVHTGDSVGVVVDTTKRELSFVLNGVNRGVAYEGIPLDKPLVPCVPLYYPGDSVELII